MTKKRIFRVLVIVTMTLWAFYALKFLVTTWNYNEISSDISAVVESAEKNGWDIYHTSFYKQYSEKRETLVKTNDMARFLFHSGYSVTGQIVRVAVFLVACIYLVAYIMFMIYYISYLVSYWSNRYL